MGARPQGASFHPVAYHNLDVAACLQELLTQNPHLLQHIGLISAQGGVQQDSAERREALASVLVWLAAVHDAGKFLDSFQGQLPDLMLELQGRPPLPTATSRRVRHDQMSCLLWAKRLAKPTSVALSMKRQELRKLQPWASAVLSHHGAPPNTSLNEMLQEHAPSTVLEDVARWFEDTLELLKPDMKGLADSRQAAQDSAWLVAGLAITADWLGSSGEWFSYHVPTLSLREYWRQVALPRARVAVKQSGLTRPRPRAFEGHAQIFPGFSSLTPTQALAATTELPRSAQIWLLEEATGSTWGATPSRSER